VSDFEEGLPPEAKQFFDFLKNSSAQARADQIGGSRMGLASQIFFLLAQRYILVNRTPKFRPEIAGLAVMYADALILALKTPPEMMK
jgi:hypothetical protein